VEIVNVKSQVVRGVMARTKNADEMVASSAKIGHLWGEFGGAVAGKMQAGAATYGVYYQYASDFMGEFNVLAGADLIAEGAQVDLASVTIHEGKYLVFKGKGEMPQAVIAAWAAIWAYFSAADCAHERAYTTDFELYKGINEVAVHIAIK
jgi:predicted transcriptional regulator YdeE